MPQALRFAARHGKRVVGLTLVTVLYGLTRPADSTNIAASLARRFQFEATDLPGPSGMSARVMRQVHPDLQHFAAWISAVGAAVALADLDHDGRPNDMCRVEVRTDQVVVAPVPGTGARYEPFFVNPSPLPFDSATMAPMGCLPGDFDENGVADLLVYYWGRAPIVFLARPRTATAAMSRGSFVALEITNNAERWYTNAATVADFDGDGHGDLALGNYFPDASRILDARATTSQRMQHSMSRAANGGRTRLLRWSASGTGDSPWVRYVDVRSAIPENVATGWTLALGAADLDGDLLPELYLARDFGPDQLLHNRSTPGRLSFAVLEGQRRFTTPASKVLGRDSFKGMGVDFGDVNGDGRLDICVSNIADEYALEESHFVFVSTGDVEEMKRGIAPYLDRSEPLGVSRGGWGWDCRFGDFDNDGTLEMIRAVGFLKGSVNRWPELHELAMGNDELLSRPRSWPQFLPGADISGHEPARFYASGPDGRYHDVATAVGLGTDQVTRGIATADVDDDGRLDLVFANQWEPSRFYRNESPEVGRYLGLRLRLVEAGRASRAALTAAATVQLPNGSMLTAHVDGGNGHSGKRSPDLHFGLGRLAPSDSVTVELRWRDGQGERHYARLRLQPGWHVVSLGGGSARAGDGK